MATLKICTLTKTRWITDVREIIQEGAFSVEHFDDPLKDCDCPDALARGMGVRVTTVCEFQPPDPEQSIRGDVVGNVLLIRRERESQGTFRLVAPDRSCFLMSENGQTIDRI